MPLLPMLLMQSVAQLVNSGLGFAFVEETSTIILVSRNRVPVSTRLMG